MIFTFIYLRFSFIYTSCAVNCVSVIMQYIFFLHSFVKLTCSEGIILHTYTTALSHFFTNWLSILTFPPFSIPANLSRIFMYCIFHPCKLVLHFHVPQIQPLQSGAANSCIAFSVAPWTLYRTTHSVYVLVLIEPLHPLAYLFLQTSHLSTKLSIQYSLKLSSFPQNPTYNTV